MKKLTTARAIVCVGLLGLAAVLPAAAAVINYAGTLSGSLENPPNASPGTGTAFVTVDTATNTMRVQATFSGLLGTTTAAHIHCCATAPSNAGVATQTPSFIGFPLGVTSGTFDNTFDMLLASSYNAAFLNNATNLGNTATAWVTLYTGMAAGQTYFNIHTNVFPGGEIRSFLTTVPEPGSLALLGLGLAGLALARRRGR